MGALRLSVARIGVLAVGVNVVAAPPSPAPEEQVARRSRTTRPGVAACPWARLDRQVGRGRDAQDHPQLFDDEIGDLGGPEVPLRLGPGRQRPA